jgi:hypothetical protein
MSSVFIGTLPQENAVPKDILVYKKWVERSYGWVAPVILEIPTCHITFSFAESMRLTAISMECVTEVTKELRAIDQELMDSYGDDTRCWYLEDNLETVTVSEKKFFIGNFTIKGSDDLETWSTLFTGSNTTNTEKFMFLTNTAFFRYYRIDITNNASLNSTTFDRDYYGIRKLKFYAYQYSDSQGTENVSLYEFDDVDNPKIIKISNAVPRQGDLVTTTTSGVYNVTGDALHTAVSGTEGYYSNYIIDLHKLGDTSDILTNAECIASTVSGVGTDTDAAMYIAVDKVIKYGPATAELYDIISDYDQKLMFTATQTFSTPVDTVSWTGTAETTYDTVASGTIVSGSTNFYMSGTTTRSYTTYLRSRQAGFRLTVDELTTNSGVIAADADLYMWGYSNTVRPLEMDTSNSVIFEVTTGEAYNCRLTAWDDVTHSTLANELIYGNNVRVSAMAFCCSDSKLNPGESKTPINLIRPPVHNQIFKGNTVYQGEKYYYGDFDMVYRYQTDVFGDYLMFKPMLYNITDSISYGVHDYIITLHYSYT